MKENPFYWEIEDLLSLFAASFDSIVIKRFNDDREKQDSIQVRYMYGSKDRVLFDLIDPAKTITLPCVAFTISSVVRDSSRVFHKNDLSWYNTPDKKSEFLRSPVPINISVNVSIISRYNQDINQIISNFVPYCNPYVAVSWKIPSDILTQSQEITTHIEWSGDVSIETPKDLSVETRYRVVANTSFTIKGWLFKYHNLKSSPNILTINNNYFDFDIKNLDMDNAEYLETQTISSFPIITNVYPETTSSNLESVFQLVGSNMDLVHSVYLSSSDPSMFNSPISSYNLFSNSNILSSQYPSFQGVSVDTFDKITSSIVFRYVPNVQGYLKAIVVTDGGYGISEEIRIVD